MPTVFDLALLLVFTCWAGRTDCCAQHRIPPIARRHYARGVARTAVGNCGHHSALINGYARNDSTADIGNKLGNCRHPQSSFKELPFNDCAG